VGRPEAAARDERRLAAEVHAVAPGACLEDYGHRVGIGRQRLREGSSARHPEQLAGPYYGALDRSTPVGELEALVLAHLADQPPPTTRELVEAVEAAERRAADSEATPENGRVIARPVPGADPDRAVV